MAKSIYNDLKIIFDKIINENDIANEVILNYGYIINYPNELAILKKSLGWYYFYSDDKKDGVYFGPYDKNAVIQMIIMRLPIKEDIADELCLEYPSMKLDTFEYIDDNYFKSEEEIDAYEAAHPEKKVE